MMNAPKSDTADEFFHNSAEIWEYVTEEYSKIYGIPVNEFRRQWIERLQEKCND